MMQDLLVHAQIIANERNSKTIELVDIFLTIKVMPQFDIFLPLVMRHEEAQVANETIKPKEPQG